MESKYFEEEVYRFMIRFVTYVWQLDKHNGSLTDKYAIGSLKCLGDWLKCNSLLNQTS